MIKFEEHNPTTLEQAIDAVFNSLDAAEIEFIKTEGTDSVHHGFGTALRNGWSLWDDNAPLTQHFRKRFELGHADDMSGLILAGVEARVKGETYEPFFDVERYKAFWRDGGVDPLTHEELPGRDHQEHRAVKTVTERVTSAVWRFFE